MKRVHRRATAVLISLAVMALAAPLSPAPQSVPTADQLVQKYLQAIGGRAAMEKVSSRVTKGTLDPGGGIMISLQIIEKAPDKYLQELDVPGVGAVNEGFDGKMGWESNPQMGAQDLTGAALAARRRNSQFYRWLHMRELFPELKVTGTAKVGEHETYVLDATPQEGYAERFYFDTATSLLLRRDYKLDGPEGMISFEMYYEEYREVDGIKLAFMLRRVGPDNVLLLKFTEIKQNVELDDTRFAKPAAP